MRRATLWRYGLVGAFAVAGVLLVGVLRWPGSGTALWSSSAEVNPDLPGGTGPDSAAHVVVGEPGKAGRDSSDQAGPGVPGKSGPGASAAMGPSSPGKESPGSPAEAGPGAPAQVSPGVPGHTGAGSPAEGSPDSPGEARVYRWLRVAAGFERPVQVVDPGDGSGRLLVVEQAGRIRLVSAGGTQEEPFLDLRDRVNSRGNEQGLLSLAFDPDFPERPEFYVVYTRADNADVLARYRMPDAGARRVDPDSGETLLVVPEPYPNHNGGLALFGPDGYLYLGLGDGGSAGDPHGNAQNRSTLLGSLLRLDVREGLSIPPRNPFTGTAWRPEIWAFGLRNPWRFSFDRATGDLYIADVGQRQWEEINFEPAGSPGGRNYGWNLFEGNARYRPGEPATPVAWPVAVYSHEEGCSVTGGYVYRGRALPGLRGSYFFGDWCSGKIWRLRRTPAGEWRQELFMETPYRISSFGEDAAGELYLVDHQGGAIYRLSSG